jgi:hydroxymethylbilane synthase
LALQCRVDAKSTIELLQTLHDPTTARCVHVERELVALLEGDCHSPIAAFAQIEGQTLSLRTAVGAREGLPPVLFSHASGAMEDDQIVKTCYSNLLAKGAYHLLHGKDTRA